MSEIEAKDLNQTKRPVLVQATPAPDAKETKQPEPPKSGLRKLWESWRSVIIVVAVLMMVRSVVADWNDVPTGSMKPTIMEGDRIFVNKLAYGLKVPFTTIHLAHWDVPERGEIVVFNSPYDGTRLVKRVIGLPGDVIEIVDDDVKVNGKLVHYDDVDPSTARVTKWMPANSANTFQEEQLGDHKHAVMKSPLNRSPRSMYGPITVPQGQYFMLGDNRDNSADSRYIGTVPLDNIVGRSSRVVLSLNYDNYYIPRWNRFLAPLP
jgi:signal peptidase I